MNRMLVVAAIVTISVAACSGTEATTVTESVPVETTSSGLGASAGEEPDFLVEIRDLEASAAPGTLAAFVRLRGEDSSGPPTSPEQPVCVGAGRFEPVRPGSMVTVSADGSGPIDVELRGSAYDGHFGCTMWFGAELDDTARDYTVTVDDFAPITVSAQELDDAGWVLELWGDQTSVEIYCIERIDDYQPGVCRPLEPAA